MCDNAIFTSLFALFQHGRTTTVKMYHIKNKKQNLWYESNYYNKIYIVSIDIDG